MFSIRAHQGFILVMRWTRLDKTLCAVCGTALIRNMTTRTLWQGWWGVGSLLVGTPLTLVSNLRTYRRLRHLPVAAPAPGRVQLQLGRPILQRPLAYVALLPFGWALWLLINGLAG